mgnify:CR=1 FL=1
MGAGGRQFESARPDQWNQADAGIFLRLRNTPVVDSVAKLSFHDSFIASEGVAGAALRLCGAEWQQDHECRPYIWPVFQPKIAAEFRALIASSRCVIVDLTENKQNVYYELGYIQAGRKTCVITAEAGTQPFFYPREHKIIFYASARELRETLTSELGGLLRTMPGL